MTWWIRYTIIWDGWITHDIIIRQIKIHITRYWVIIVINHINIRTDNINIQTTSINSVNPFEQIVLDPPDINFKKNLKGYKTKEKAYKLNMKKELIINHINGALSIYTDEEKKYNTDIVLFVCQCVEDLINVPKSGELKSEVVQKVCSKYFEGKETKQ